MSVPLQGIEAYTTRKRLEVTLTSSPIDREETELKRWFEDDTSVPSALDTLVIEIYFPLEDLTDWCQRRDHRAASQLRAIRYRELPSHSVMEVSNLLDAVPSLELLAVGHRGRLAWAPIPWADVPGLANLPALIDLALYQHKGLRSLDCSSYPNTSQTVRQWSSRHRPVTHRLPSSRSASGVSHPCGTRGGSPPSSLRGCPIHAQSGCRLQDQCQQPSS